MKNKLFKIMLITLVVAALVVSFSIVISAAGPASGNSFNRTTAIAPGTRSVNLTEAERESLTLMREEEKLARDVYLFLGEKWDLVIFSNIAASEQKHMDSILTLLNRYGIPDPAAGDVKGEFSNPELQMLYTELITQGSESLVAALQTGVLIEKTDIADLEEGLGLTQKRDISNVFRNLLRGSNNHLKAFNTELELLK